MILFKKRLRRTVQILHSLVMKQILLILICIASSISLSYAEETKNLPVADFSDMRKMKNTQVVDVVTPQTLLLKNGSIAYLSGIDIPGSFGEEISPLAVTARDILKDLLSGKNVETYQTRDKNSGRVNRMGHDLMHLARFEDKAWAQGTLLSLGLARVKTTIANREMSSQMLALEEIARNEKLGIWADDRYGVISPEDAEARIGEFVVVEGRIESVAIKKNRIYINFGKDWKTDFTVSIAPEHKRSFNTAGLNPMSWGGKDVRVRGSLRSYNGPYMEISHPETIEFIQE